MPADLAPQVDPLELFELVMLGGPTERRYRRMRPDVEALPWGTLDPSRYPEADVLSARKSWTDLAFQEHRAAAASAQALQAMVAARAPLDLIAFATRFPLDELVHIEVCARVAMEIGGGAPLLHDPAKLVEPTDPTQPPLVRAAELVVRLFCVNETVSTPLLWTTWRAARPPLLRAALGCLVKDEAAHGKFGWTFLDWVIDQLSAEERSLLGAAAGDELGRLAAAWDPARFPPSAPPSSEVHAFAWMEGRAFAGLARRTLQRAVVEPLRRRGIEPERAP